ncbi:Ribosomal-protein-alanine N-acetyltransferase [Paenibacillus vortex V453]|uniref:Ribosomal-protein-alanine N-acetyltransferase n=1 Tax=Paenibacillus vortex V453 TaxID=715225 RepID=A0A2R9SQP8_9BACL|nr:Ribosomal-protein-alanine N-acetyltransferase [Paenibacillus vortex V453]
MANITSAVEDPGSGSGSRSGGFYRRERALLQNLGACKGTGYFTIGKQVELLAAERRSIADGSLFKVWLHQDDKIIGSVAVSNIVRGVFQSGHVGYKLAQSHTGNGYMTEALSAVVSHCFDTLEMHRLEANIMPRNAASLNVVRRLGFYEEGLAIKYLKINGVWEDHLHMVIRNERLE